MDLAEQSLWSHAHDRFRVLDHMNPEYGAHSVLRAHSVPQLPLLWHSPVHVV